MYIFYLIIPVLFILFLVGVIRNWQTQNSLNQKLFLKGKVPKPPPDGFFKGHVENLKTNWQGKKFNSQKSSGVNLIKGKEVFPFKTYIAKGLKDKNLDVYRIDYNIAKNPLSLRLILDEIVEIKKNKYLGKVHIRLAPFLAISVGYFKLEKLS